ncbi:hypothetical protein ZWY2020_041750 [Hordeum vulgare]|nr:hypothetical protein ZWY2020_041750 [Hordeum vulgare]
MELVNTIFAVARKIAKAVETARENKAMCLDLADRASTICNILRQDRDSGAIMTAGGGDSQASQITRRTLERLKAALDDALDLVESQRQSGVIERAVASFTVDVARKFQLLQTRISDCVNDLKYAKLVAADHRAQDDNTRAAPLKPSSFPRPSDLVKQLQPPHLPKPSSFPRPSDLVKQLQPPPLPKPSSFQRPSDLVKQLQPPPLPKPSSFQRPSDLVKQLQPPRPSTGEAPQPPPRSPDLPDLVKAAQPSPRGLSDLVNRKFAQGRRIW